MATPLKSTIEAVDGLNSLKGPRTSPRKRKNPPTTLESSPKTRLKRLSVKSATAGSSSQVTQPDAPHSPASGGPLRQNVYEMVAGNEEKKPPPKKQRSLKPRTKQPLFGAGPREDMDLPEVVVRGFISSPAKGTRSHDKPGARVDTKTTTNNDNDMAVRPGSSHPLTEQPTDLESGSRRVYPTSPRKRGRGRPSKAAAQGKKGLVFAEQDKDINIVEADGESARAQSDVRDGVYTDYDLDRYNRGESQKTGGNLPEEVRKGKHSVKSPKKLLDDGQALARTEQEEEELDALSGIEEASELHSCRTAWARMLSAAKKIKQDGKSLRYMKTKNAVKIIKHMKNSYETIADATVSAEDLMRAEETIKEGIEMLEEFCAEITPKDALGLDAEVLQEFYELVIPRSVFLLKFALRARYENGGLSIAALAELLDLIDVAMRFWGLASRSKSAPTTLESSVKKIAKGGILGNLNRIAKQYNNVIAEHEAEIGLEEERSRKAEAYERSLGREAEKRAREAEELVEQLAEARQKREQAMRAAAKNEYWDRKSEYNARLCRKLGVELPPQPGRAVAPTVFDIDDMAFEADAPRSSDHERPVDGLSAPSTGLEAANHKPLSYRPSRPRLQRERTEEIPGPTPKTWSDEEKVALCNGLQEFFGRDRYKDILDAPQYKHILGNKDEYEVMQQALFLKQSMASHLVSLEGDWTWLKSIPG